MLHQHQLQQQVELDPINKFKVLVPMMKKSLQNLMEIAANIFHQNSHVDSCVKGAESPTDRFDKCLEEFYAHCDQIEITLKLALECHGQSVEAHRNTPVALQVQLGQSPQKSPGEQQGQEQQSYSQYLTLVRSQINCAREIHDSLLECSKKMGERLPSSLPMQAPSSVGAVGSN